MIRKMILCAAAAMLSACATSYPDLYSSKPPPAAVPSETPELDQILIDAYWLQYGYANGYKETAKIQDLSQLPLIAAATWAARILLENKAGAATQAGKIGIAATAYTAARGQLLAPGLPDAYIAGHGALTCVLAEGSMFSGEPAKSRYSQLQTQLQDIADQIADTSAARWREPAKVGTQAEALKTARSLADQAIANARTAETAALTQEAAFLGAAPIFRNAVASISVRVASKGRVRPAVDFATLRDSMAPPKSAGGATPESAGGPRSNDVNTIINDLIGKTNALISMTARLTAGTPAYSQSLTRVGGCPEQIK